MFGDLSVQKDFIENFMLTDLDEMWYVFYSEVYPGSKGTSGDIGMMEICSGFHLDDKNYMQRFVDTMEVAMCYRAD